MFGLWVAGNPEISAKMVFGVVLSNQLSDLATWLLL